MSVFTAYAQHQAIDSAVRRTYINKPGLKAGAFLVVVLFAFSAAAQVPDLSANYDWRPVRIGAGGFVVGMTIHPRNPLVRYARTDVGNAYRWDEPRQSWFPMRVVLPDGSGVHDPSATASPSTYGVDSVAIDPQDPSIVYMVFPTLRSCDMGCADESVQLYKSTDSGRNFYPGGLAAAHIKGDPNGANRQHGERLAVDPINSKTLYYGSDSQGLFRSRDGGATWLATNLPHNEFISIEFAAHETVELPGSGTVSKMIYATSMANAKQSGGDVYLSKDGGENWVDLSTGVQDMTGKRKFVGQAASTSIDALNRLYVVENPETNGSHRAYWRYVQGAWQRISLESNGANQIVQPLQSVAADPLNPHRIYALGIDTSLSRSDDDGVTWVSFGNAHYANQFAWLPQTVGMQHANWHSNGGIVFDSAGNLWAATGQEGPLTISHGEAVKATGLNPPKWTILARGIEEMVASDLLIPEGTNDTIIAVAEDTTGFVVTNPDDFSAVQIPLQPEIIAQGTSVDNAPDVPSYIAISSSNVYNDGPNYSGYSPDGGKTWKRFGPFPKYHCRKALCDIPAGTIAVSRRDTRSLGHDHLVLLAPANFAPMYSLDGGASWTVSASFPRASDRLHLDVSGGLFLGFSVPELHQHLLRADPFMADKFYLKLQHAPATLYVSTDGGKTWQGQAEAALPNDAWHGQLVANRKQRNDLWYADGWEGSTAHGLFHSVDGGKSFTALTNFAHAVTVAIGAGSGQASDAAYTVFCYGQLRGDAVWGVFQSSDAGQSWSRIVRYPLGIFDRPVTMAASPDTFGKVYLGWSGNSFAYGQLRSTAALPRTTR